MLSQKRLKGVRAGEGREKTGNNFFLKKTVQELNVLYKSPDFLTLAVKIR